MVTEPIQDFEALAESIGIDLDDWEQDAVDKLPSQLAYAYDRLAAANQLFETYRAAYRRWKASEAEAELERAPKDPEWKIRNKVESDPKFAIHKKRLGDAQATVTRWEGLIFAIKKKCEIYQSRTGWMRDQLKHLDN